ncbi:MAG: threonine-phosphate decarboxylase [Peptococcaceae bacterium]|nr:threonine-phosphate decarboxylase [Peptococcaceae bacterium]
MYKYVHGGDIYTAKDLTGNSNIIDFSANINPLGLPPGVEEAVLAALPECQHYPDPFCRELIQALAAYEHVPRENVYCANGASEIIFRLALALKPKKALLLAPSFADYEKALGTVGTTLEFYPLAAENDFHLKEDFLQFLNRSYDMVWICNPNNPTGQGYEASFLKEVLECCHRRNTLVLVDECFMDFVDEPEKYSVQHLIESYNNLLILKAFTKIFAMPGLRLGYLLTANQQIIDRLRTAGQDWSVSVIAQKAGICALKQTEYLQKTRQLIKRERQFLLKELNKLGVRTYGSLANYIFFQTPGHRELDKQLLARGILIRSCANYRGLNSEFFRIAVKNRAVNLILVAALKDIIKL